MTATATTKAGERTHKVEVNGNRFVKQPHIFIQGEGCYFPTLEIAIAQGTSPNGVGLWTKQIEFNGSTYFKAGNTNVWH